MYCRYVGASGGFAPWTPTRALPWTHWGAYSAQNPSCLRHAFGTITLLSTFHKGNALFRKRHKGDGRLSKKHKGYRNQTLCDTPLYSLSLQNLLVIIQKLTRYHYKPTRYNSKPTRYNSKPTRYHFKTYSLSLQDLLVIIQKLSQNPREVFS